MALHPNDHFKQGRYMGPSIDMDLSLTARTLKDDSQVFHRSMFQALNQGEWEWEDCKAECSLFIKLLQQRLGPQATVEVLAELGVEYTLQYNPSEDELQNSGILPTLNDKPEVTPKGGGQYLNAEILL